MGLMDDLENKALSSVLGGSSNPMAASLLQMVNNHPGGVAGLVQSFHQNGMSEIVSLWVGTGQNLPVSADQIQQVLGNSPLLQQFAAKAGISPQDASSKLAQYLPMIVDHLTPQGKVA
jgi:uncharacterized protein YidB (DUF937 family)